MPRKYRNIAGTPLMRAASRVWVLIRELLCRICAVVGRDETHPAHIGGQAVHLINTARGLQAVIPAAQVEKFEFVGIAGAIFRIFDICTAHPIAFFAQECDEMVTNKAACTGNKNTESETCFLLLQFIFESRRADTARSAHIGQDYFLPFGRSSEVWQTRTSGDGYTCAKMAH